MKDHILDLQRSMGKVMQSRDASPWRSLEAKHWWPSMGTKTQEMGDWGGPQKLNSSVVSQAV